MSRLVTRLPDFGAVYDERKQREMARHLEQQLARVRVDSTTGAYTASGDFTASADDDVVLVDTSSADVTVTLPEISESMVREKYEVEIVKVSKPNRIRILPGGTDTIQEQSDALVYVQWTALRFRAAVGQWVVI